MKETTEANQLDNDFSDFNSLSKKGENKSIANTIRNKKLEVNNIKKLERMFAILLIFFGIVLLVGFWSIVFGIIDFFKELNDKNKDSV